MTTGNGPFSSSFTEADLHGFVDGRLEPARQMDMARRLKSHAADKARTDAWREQNELIRATFSEVESEALPVSLCLTAPVRLRCVATDGLSSNAQTGSVPEKSRFINELKRRRSPIFAISALVIGVIAAGTWMLGHPPAAADRPTSAASRDLEGSLEARTMEAMTGVTAKPPRQAHGGLPAITIPDLTSSGFTFTGISSEQSDPPALMLFYEDRASQRIVIGIAKTSQTNEASQTNRLAPTPNRHAVIWRTSGHTFALTGSIAQSRLNDIAASLQASLGSAAKAD
jgi:anti-sigma factor RsiW